MLAGSTDTRTRLAAALVAWGWVPVQAAEDSVLLKPRLAPGAIHYIELVQEIEERWDDGPFGPAATERYKRLRGVFRGVEPPTSEGITRIKLVYDRVHLRQESKRGTMEFDSDAGDPRQRSNSVGNIGFRMHGGPMTMLMDQNGQIVSLTGMEEIFNRVEEGAAGNLVFEPMQSDFTDETAKFMWGDSRYALYPNRKVKTGDTWQRRLRTHDLYWGDLVYECEFKVDRIQKVAGNKVAEISYQADISTLVGWKRGYRLFNCRMTVKSGKWFGTATYDVAAGQIVRQTDETTLSIEASMTGGPEKPDMVFGIDRKIKRQIRVLPQAEREAEKKRAKNP